MAAQRGLDSLMGMRPPASVNLTPEVLRVAMKGLLTFREMELNQVHSWILGSKCWSCSDSDCPSRIVTGARVSEAHQAVVDRIVDSAHFGTKILEVLSLKEICGGSNLGFCGRCVKGWESEHADVRESAWGLLLDISGSGG